MKKLLIALTALALTVATASAQTTPAPAGPTPTNGRHLGQGAKSPVQQADRRAAKMTKELGLNADQEAKIEAVFLAQSQDMQALKAKYAGNPSRQAMRPEAQTLRDKYDGQLKAALGADVYARYDKLREERHDKMKQARGARKGKTKAKIKG
ncbi:hypothetical protein [uncultured Hymenobacter sp.]|uniref:hypothetical protein n=1 Tax=uncultured Hymenobacter sp. TaxID=170016 RepID=UPI0035C953FD